MSPSRFSRLVLAASVAALLVPVSTQASILYWDGGTADIGTVGDAISQGGSGTWNTSLLNWDPEPAGSPHVAWPNTTADEAVFGGVAGTVSLGSAITANRLTFQIGGYTIDNGGTAANTLTLGGTNPTVTVTNLPDLATISAVIAGTAGLNKAGAGTLSLTGTNTYTGVTSVAAGTLQIGSDLNLGTAPVAATPGNLSLSGGGTLATTTTLTLATNRGLALGTGGGSLNIGAGTTTTYGGVIAGTTLLTKSGTGTLILSGTNNVTATGGTAVTGGVLQVGANTTLPGGGILLDGGTLRVTATNTLASGQVIAIGNSGGTIDQNLATKLIIPANFLTGSGTLTRTASGTNVTVGTSNNVSITGANIGFTGAVILSGGQTEVSANGLGNATMAGNTITVNNSAELTANNSTLPNAVTINAGATIGGDNGTSNFSGALAVNGAFNVRLGDFYQSTNRNLIISGPLSGTGAITLLNANSTAVPTVGSGQTLFLNGSNANYLSSINFPAGFNVSFGAGNSVSAGGTTINSTTAALGGIGVGYDFGTTLPTFTNSRTGTTTGGVFGINTTLAAATTLDLATLGGGGMFLGSQGAGTYAAGTLGADGGNYRLGGGLGTLTLGGANVLTGTNALIAGDTRTNGTGTVILAAANDYTGATTINGGTTLQINNGAALGGTATGTVVNAGGSLALSGGITVNEPLTITGTSATAGTTNITTGLVNVTGTNTYAGPINAGVTSGNNVRVSATAGTLNLAGDVAIAGGGTANGFVFAGAGAINQTAGVISGGGSLISTSSSTVTLLGNNTFTGKTQIQSGTVRTPSLNSVAGGTAASGLGAPTSAPAGVIELGSGTSVGTLIYTGTGETTDRMVNLIGTTGGGTIEQGGTGLLRFTTAMTAAGTGAGTKTFTLQGSTTGTGEFAGLIVNNSTTNLTNVAKGGTSAWTLSGLNTYSGTTSINQGTLTINTLTAVGGAASSLGSPTTVANGTIGLGSGSTTPLGGILQYVGTGSTSDRVINLASTTGSGTLDQSGTGTFQVGAVTATGAGSKTLNLTGSTTGVGVVGGAIANNSTTNLTLVTKSGSGTWTLAGTNTYTGATVINGGLLRFTGNSSAATGAVTVNSGGYLGGSGSIGGAVTVAANGGVDLRDGAVGTLTLGSTLTFSGTATTQNTVAFDLGSASVDRIAATGAVTAATAGATLLTFNQLAGTALPNGTYPLITSSAATSTTTGFALATTQSGGRTYALTTAATGNIVQVTVGTAATGPAAAVWGGTTSALWTAAGNWYTDPTSGTPTGAIPGVGSNVSFYTTTPAAINLSTTLGADFEINSLSFLNTDTTAVTIAGATNALVIDATTANGNTLGNGINQQSTQIHTISSRLGLGGNQTWTVAAGGGLTVSGLVFDTGNAAILTKAGAGTLTLSGTSNTFTGDINVTEGTLAFAGNNGTSGDPLSLGAGSKTITLTNNATVRPTSTANPTAANTKRFVIGSGGGTFNVPSGVTFSLDDATQFSGTGDLTVTGAGAVFLNNQAFNFSGNVLVSSGTLRLGTNSVLGTAPGRNITVSSGATLDTNNTVTAANVPLGVILNGGTLSASGANGSFAQAVTLGANSTVSAGNGFTETVSGNITGGFSLTKAGAGITVLSGTNTYGPASGASTIITAGALQAARTASLPNFATPGQVTVTSGGSLLLNVGGTGEFTGANVTSLLSNGSFATGSGIGFDTTNSGGSFTAPTIVATPAVAALSLTKLGTGTLVLPNASAFGTGNTTILNGTVSTTSGGVNPLGTGALVLGSNGGLSNALDLGTSSQTFSTLAVNNTISTAASTVTVAAGQTLSFTGAVAIGPVPTAANQVSNLTLTGGGALNVAATGTTFQIGGNNLAAGTTFSERAAADFTGLGAATINLGAAGTLRVNSTTGGNVSGNQSSLNLPTPTVASGTLVTAITAGTLAIGDAGGNGSGTGQINSVVLGTGLTNLRVNTVNIGTGLRDVGSLTFAAGNGTLNLRGADGSSRVAFNLGSSGGATGVANGTGVAGNLVDLTGHDSNLLISTLNIGDQPRNVNQNYAFRFDTGTLTASGVVLGSETQNGTLTGTSTQISTLAIGGGTVNIETGAVQIGNVSDTNTGAAVRTAVGNFEVSGGNVTLGSNGTYSVRLGNNTSTSTTLMAATSLSITGGTVAAASNIIAGSTTRTTSTLTLDGGTLNLTGATALDRNIGSSAAPVNTNFRSGTLQNVAEINGGITGLTKASAGTLVLAGVNTYAGGTNVATGTVLVTGSITGNVSVSASAVLGGTGTILTGAGGSINVAATGVVAPGVGLGTLTVNAASTVAPALSLTSGATFTFELTTGVTSDRIAITNASAGSVAFAGNTINFSDLSSGGLSNGNYLLFTADAANPYSGLTTDGSGFITSGLTIGSGLNAYPGTSLQVVGNDIVLAVVPEPGSATMLLASLGSLLGLRRFRRRA